MKIIETLKRGKDVLGWWTVDRGLWTVDCGLTLRCALRNSSLLKRVCRDCPVGNLG